MREPPTIEQLNHAKGKRAILLNCLTLSFVILTSTLTIVWLYVYNVKLWMAVPFVVISAILGFVGSTFMFSIWFGIWYALRPISKDLLNPVNYARDLAPDTRVAMVMPVYHEDPRRVCASVAATMSEMADHPQAHHFEWFILSDSRKEDLIAQERMAVYFLNDMFPNAKIAYRNRVVNSDAKVGNMDDFLRRWGNHYDYMIVFDADTIMPGETAINFARTMQGNDRIGIIQGISYETNSSTLFGRLKNFSHNITLLTGAAAQCYHKLHQATFYGHGAILNVRAMQEHCNLPRFHRQGPFAAGKPTSHDYIEAALLEGAGYQCWRLHLFPSFDDQIHNAIDYAKRENRWTFGALDWLRLFMLKSLSFNGKMNLLMSSLNYFNAVIGLGFFIMTFTGLSYILRHPLRTRMIVAHFHQLTALGMMLFIVSVSMMTCCNLFYHYKTRNLHRYGGSVKLVWSSFLVMANGWFNSSSLMIIVNQIVMNWLRGKKMVWSSQNREGRIVGWGEAFSLYGLSSVFGFMLTAYSWVYILPYTGSLRKAGVQPYWVLFWMAPPIIGLVFAPVIARVTSQRLPWMEKMGWLLDPFEFTRDMPPEGKVLITTREMNKKFDAFIPEDWTMEDALKNPYFALRHLAHLPRRQRKTQYWMPRLKNREFSDLTRKEKLLVFRTGGLWEMYIRRTLLQNDGLGDRSSP